MASRSDQDYVDKNAANMLDSPRPESTPMQVDEEESGGVVTPYCQPTPRPSMDILSVPPLSLAPSFKPAYLPLSPHSYPMTLPTDESNDRTELSPLAEGSAECPIPTGEPNGCADVFVGAECNAESLINPDLPTPTGAKSTVVEKHWLHRVSSSLAPDANLEWYDGLVAAECSEHRFIITSPNVDYIPQPVVGAIRVVRQRNGHFGIHDPIVWPQVLVNKPRLVYLMAVSRQPNDALDYRLPIWQPLSTKDIVLVPDSFVRGFATVSFPRRRALKFAIDKLVLRARALEEQSPGQHEELQHLVDTMEQAYDRLDFPASERDLIRQHAIVQRFWLMADAWIEFHVHLFGMVKFTDPEARVRNMPRTDLMGAFTNIPDFAQKMFIAGVPVWFIRYEKQLKAEHTILKTVRLQQPHFREDCGLFSDLPIYEAWSGEGHLLAIAAHAHGYQDLDHVLCSEVLHPDGVMPSSRTTRPSGVAPEPPGGSQIAGVAVESSSPRLIAGPSGAAQTDGTAGDSSGKEEQTGPIRQLKVHASRSHPYQKSQARSSSVAQKGRRNGNKPKAGSNTNIAEPANWTNEERDKWEDLSHDLLPPGIPAWTLALSRVNRNARAATRGKVWGYWLPEAALLISSEKRTGRYVANWLRIREAWYWVLSNDFLQRRKTPPPRPQEWREYLNYASWSEADMAKCTLTAQRKRRVFEIFEGAFGSENISLGKNDQQKWFRSAWSPSDKQQMREIMWELCDLGFRYELTELDRHFVPSAESDVSRRESQEAGRHRLIQRVFCGRPMILSALPVRNEGLAAPDIRDRAESLGALLMVMKGWPNVPSEITGSPPLTESTPIPVLTRIEKKMFQHYVPKRVLFLLRSPAATIMGQSYAFNEAEVACMEKAVSEAADAVRAVGLDPGELRYYDDAGPADGDQDKPGKKEGKKTGEKLAIAEFVFKKLQEEHPPVQRLDTEKRGVYERRKKVLAKSNVKARRVWAETDEKYRARVERRWKSVYAWTRKYLKPNWTNPRTRDTLESLMAEAVASRATKRQTAWTVYLRERKGVLAGMLTADGKSDIGAWMSNAKQLFDALSDDEKARLDAEATSSNTNPVTQSLSLPRREILASQVPTHAEACLEFYSKQIGWEGFSVVGGVGPDGDIQTKTSVSSGSSDSGRTFLDALLEELGWNAGHWELFVLRYMHDVFNPRLRETDVDLISSQDSESRADSMQDALQPDTEEVGNIDPGHDTDQFIGADGDDEEDGHGDEDTDDQDFTHPELDPHLQTLDLTQIDVDVDVGAGSLSAANLDDAARAAATHLPSHHDDEGMQVTAAHSLTTQPLDTRRERDPILGLTMDELRATILGVLASGGQNSTLTALLPRNVDPATAESQQLTRADWTGSTGRLPRNTNDIAAGSREVTPPRREASKKRGKRQVPGKDRKRSTPADGADVSALNRAVRRKISPPKLDALTARPDSDVEIADPVHSVGRPARVRKPSAKALNNDECVLEFGLSSQTQG
ncbi:hypothetical protein NM688_g7551 [Phlebia brevispora]|uniref:Uncharacterized protein n=1 Tax=Phlebia brevispora TaxID=194682 RepID=A0ACC1S3X9_9APHY|nr:hypothetical protein NM688_g7551 [Phlebia brevispora]